jgi:ribosome recycling factor
MEQKLNQVANITIIDAQTMRIEPWDKKTLRDIESAIYESQLGFTPVNHGDYILIKVPALTQERRKEITKLVSKE